MKPTWKPVPPKGAQPCANCGWRIAALASVWCGVCADRAAEVGGTPPPDESKASKRERLKRTEGYLFEAGFIPDADGKFIGEAEGRESA